jgi:hypothetical protein
MFSKTPQVNKGERKADIPQCQKEITQQNQHTHPTQHVEGKNKCQEEERKRAAETRYEHRTEND